MAIPMNLNLKWMKGRLPEKRDSQSDGTKSAKEIDGSKRFPLWSTPPRGEERKGPKPKMGLTGR